jgi:hypothetical protein
MDVPGLSLGRDDPYFTQVFRAILQSFHANSGTICYKVYSNFKGNVYRV